MGSDHCPVYAAMGETVAVDGGERAIQDVMNPADMFRDGKRVREVGSKDLLAFSARLLPEFDLNRRRNIKDMFKRHPSNAATSVPVPQSHASQPASPATSHSPSQPPRSQTMIAVSPSTPAAPKRKSQGEASAAKTKKLKPAQTATGKGKGQGTLQSFFRPAAAKKETLDTVLEDKHNNPKVRDNDRSYNGVLGDMEATSITNTEADPIVNDADNQRSSIPSQVGEDVPGIHRDENELASQDEEDVAWAESVESRIDNSQKWGQLFKKMQPPLCEDHNEPCISLDTKKKGFNCGRKFWICPRPVGPSGAKEKNTQWRCRTFIWASDWNGGGSG